MKTRTSLLGRRSRSLCLESQPRAGVSSLGVMVALTGLVAAGCAGTAAKGPMGPGGQGSTAMTESASPMKLAGLSARGSALSAPRGEDEEKRPRVERSRAVDVKRLRKLYSERSRGAAVDEYPIGAGDLIEISVPAMDEITDETVRVSEKGTVAIPLLGAIEAAGLSEADLHQEVHDRLQRYMYRPEFSLIVREHHNRQVGVLGAVVEPGLHPVNSSKDTILEMISRAGGLTDEATQRLLFIPAERVAAAEAAALHQNVKLQELYANQPEVELIKAAPPIVIDLERLNKDSQQLALAVPVRPGDTIMAMGGGQVFVQGWVVEPGAIKMSRGLSVLGAIAAAGGLSFPADRNTVRLLREKLGSAERDVIEVDIAQIEGGHAEDVLLREGDLIEIQSSGGKLVAYGVYHFFSNVLRTGIALSPF